jgi:hypothetical protein
LATWLLGYLTEAQRQPGMGSFIGIAERSRRSHMSMVSNFFLINARIRFVLSGDPSFSRRWPYEGELHWSVANPWRMSLSPLLAFHRLLMEFSTRQNHGGRYRLEDATTHHTFAINSKDFHSLPDCLTLNFHTVPSLADDRIFIPTRSLQRSPALIPTRHRLQQTRVLVREPLKRVRVSSDRPRRHDPARAHRTRVHRLGAWQR